MPELKDIILHDFPQLVPHEKKSTGKTLVVYDTENDRFTTIAKVEELLNTLGIPSHILDHGSRAGKVLVVDNKLKIDFKNQKTLGGNKGHAFENKLASDLNKAVNSPESLEDLGLTYLQGIFDILPRDEIQTVQQVGKRNVARTLQKDQLPENMIILPNLSALPDEALKDTEDIYDKIGAALSDIDVVTFDEKYHFISVKSSPTVAFLNTGLGRDTAEGWERTFLGILAYFGGVNPQEVIDGLEAYWESHEVKDKSGELRRWRYFDDPSLLQEVPFNPENVTNMLKQAIGKNYIMVHDQHTYYVDESTVRRYSSPVQLEQVKFPHENRMRFDYVLRTDGLKIHLAIRDKNRTGRPTQMVIEYKEL
jgi:hypothetical protein